MYFIMLFNSDTLSHITCIRINAPRWVLFKRSILSIGTERDRDRGEANRQTRILFPFEYKIIFNQILAFIWNHRTKQNKEDFSKIKTHLLTLPSKVTK